MTSEWNIHTQYDSTVHFLQLYLENFLKIKIIGF